LHDRDNLWRLLFVVTERKASHVLRAEARQKRGGKMMPSREPTAPGFAEVGLEQLLSREPAPDFAALVAEEYQQMLAKLGDHSLQTVVSWKMEGYTNEEIARKLDCTPRSVYRKLRIIRGLWEKELSR
jgi:DNA-directed RNA polymerase specialized sigma24 family protein